MRLDELAVGRWFHDPSLGVEGKVLSKSVGGVSVKLLQPEPIVIHGETVGVRRWTKPQTLAGSWEVEPGRVQPEKEDVGAR